MPGSPRNLILVSQGTSFLVLRSEASQAKARLCFGRTVSRLILWMAQQLGKTKKDDPMPALS